MTKGHTTKFGQRQKDKEGFADVWVQEQYFTCVVLISTNHWENNCKRDQKLYVAIVRFIITIISFIFYSIYYIFDIEHVIEHIYIYMYKEYIEFIFYIIKI